MININYRCNVQCTKGPLSKLLAALLFQKLLPMQKILTHSLVGSKKVINKW